MILEKAQKRFVAVFSHEPWWVEFWSACTALFWAYLSFLLGDQIYNNQIFMELSLVANSKFWQLTAVLVGIFQLTILLINNYKLRWVSCFCASWFWTFLAIAVFQIEPYPPSLALYVSYAGINLLSMVKLSRSHA